MSMKTKRSKKKLFIFIGAAVVIVIALTAMVAYKKRDKPIPVTTDKAFRKSVTQLVTATGKIQPEIEVKIAPEVSGEIIEIPVKEGQTVRKGALLLKIKPDSYQAQVESQLAALNAARSSSVRNRAELSKAEQDYKRASQLFQAKLLPESDRNAAQTSFEIAKAALDSSLFEIQRAEGALRQIRDALSKTIIYAPADGSVSSLTSRVGERVVGTVQFAGTEVMRIANLDNMEARVNVNENDVVNVHVGDVARISVDAYPDRKIRGVVREIASTATTRNAGSQEEVTNFEVKISIPDPEHIFRLRPGMSATADIEAATVQNAVVVPIQSVTVRSTEGTLSPEERERRQAEEKAREGGDNRADVSNQMLEKQKERELREKLERVVFIKSGDTVRMQKVETGIADSTYIELKSGVKAGDEVVSGSYTAISRRLKDGSKVEIEKAGKT
jgi:HlyD family secretion protein